MPKVSRNGPTGQNRQNRSGSQRYKCQSCGRKYTPEPKQQGYSAAVRREAVENYVDGLNFRRTGRVLKVAHTSVMNWVKARACASPTTDGVRTGRVIHLHRRQKNEVYILTNVNRGTRCIVGWDVVFERDYDQMQAMLDRSPQAKQYYSDAFAVYDTLVYYPGHHRALLDKSQTYSVEADIAELRHYLARLARKSRCFSRCIHALWRAVKLFVFASRRRQLYKQAFPRYPRCGPRFRIPLTFTTPPTACS